VGDAREFYSDRGGRSTDRPLIVGRAGEPVGVVGADGPEAPQGEPTARASVRAARRVLCLVRDLRDRSQRTYWDRTAGKFVLLEEIARRIGDNPDVAEYDRQWAHFGKPSDDVLETVIAAIIDEELTKN
jgi:hypothetical protein